MGNVRKISGKQKLFCDWYIKLCNGSKAAIKAGYAKGSAAVTASKLLTKANIQAYLTKRRTQYEELLGFNKATIIQDLIEIKDKCKQAKPVMKWDHIERAMVQETEDDGEGNEVGVYQFDSNGAIRATETINKMMGYNEPEKVEDVTPNERKIAPVTIVKTYVKSTDQPPDKANPSVGPTGDGTSG